MSLSLDGGTTFIGTEFLKLEITGTSALATEKYVNTQVAQGGGGGGDSYTQAETDTLLNGKVDLTNLNQTINGKIDIIANPIPLALKDETDGHKMRFTHGKHIDVFTEPETATPVPLYLNYFNQGNVRVGDTAGSLSINNNNPNSKTFSCNGDAEFLSTLTVASTLQSTSIKTNTINTNGDVNLNFQQNSVNFMYFDATNDKIELSTPLNSNSDIASTILKGETLSNYNVNGLTLDTTTNSIYIKNNTATKIEVQSDKIIMSDPLNCNTFNSNGVSDITFKRNDIEYCKLREDGTVRLLEFPSNGGVSANQLYGNYFNNRSFGWDTIFQGSNVAGDGREEYMRYNYATGILSIAKPLSLSSALKQDVIDTTSDVDLTVKRNNVDYFTLQVDGGNKLMNFASNGAVSANRMYGNYFSNRGYSTDTIFEGSNTAGNDRVEYMRYDFTNEVIQLPKKLLVNGGDGKTEIYENVETTNNVFRI